MTTFVVGTDSVHTSAAICDYLLGRIAAEDTAHAINVVADNSDPASARDGQDALNAVAARLAAAASVETTQRETEADPATELCSLSDRVDADELLVAGDPPADATTVDGVTEQLLVQSTRPVVVVPDTAPSA